MGFDAKRTRQMGDITFRKAGTALLTFLVCVNLYLGLLIFVVVVFCLVLFVFSHTLCPLTMKQRSQSDGDGHHVNPPLYSYILKTRSDPQNQVS